MQYFDLSHTFKEQMPVFPGDGIAELKQVAFIDENGYNSYCLQTGMHVGTHIDAPFHMTENGSKLSEISVEHFFGCGKIVDARDAKIIGVEFLQNKKLESGDILFVCTGHSKKYGFESYYTDFPVIDLDFGNYVVEKGIKIIGFDSPGPDDAPYDLHKLFFKNNILIIENLTGLEQLLAYDFFEVIVLPAKFESAGAPVRVVARL